VLGQLLVGALHAGLVAAGRRDRTLELVGHQRGRDTAKELVCLCRCLSGESSPRQGLSLHGAA
jgi:hypothetical protein